VGGGWTVARTTRTAEGAMSGSIRIDERVRGLVAAAGASGRGDDPVLRQELAAAHARAMALRVTSDRVLTALRTGGAVGAEASVLKLGLSTAMGALGDLAMRVLGADGLLAGAPEGDGESSYGLLQDQFLSQWAPRIGGGTEQIQRSMIGERALGLPREPRPPTNRV
jgi:alkylation response protein AidB-like acyl-CoA dehydrogenase